MATQVQLRKGTTAQNDAFTGALAEVTVDTTLKVLRVHDGATTGGMPLVGTTTTQTLTNKTLTAPTLTGTAVAATINAATINAATIGNTGATLTGTLNTATQNSVTTMTSLSSVGTITTGTWQATDVGLAYGGTNATLTAVNGGIVYSNASAMAITAAGTAGQALLSNGAAPPVWTTLSLTDLSDAWTKKSVKAATTANITLSAPQTIDGISVVAGDRVLVKDQTAAATNGIYVVAAGAWARSTDADTASKIAGGRVNVDSGTVNGGILYDTDFKTTDTLGTTAMAWYRGVDTLYLNAWPGTSSVTTLGTVATGTWNATTIATTKGGTGLTSFTSGGALYATSTSALTTGTLPVASGGTGTTTSTGTGSVVLSASPTFTGTLSAVDLTLSGNLTVNGTTTTINATTLTVDDKNIELGSVATPTDTTADGGGITLKGATDKTFNWVSATGTWTSSEHLGLASGKAFYINGTSVLNATTLGSGVTASSLTSVGTISTGVWQGSSIATTYTAAKVTDVQAGTGVTVSSTTGSVTVNIGQAVATTSSPTFAGITVPSITHSGTSGTGDIGASGAAFGTVWAKATSAQYADVAEKYTADKSYAPGTVVVFGGPAEVTASKESHDSAVAGVVSTNPAYLMNSEIDGVAVALLGRVPCQIKGPIAKGEAVVTSDIEGVAQRLEADKFNYGCIIGKALESIDTTEVKVIEVVVGRF